MRRREATGYYAQTMFIPYDLQRGTYGGMDPELAGQATGGLFGLAGSMIGSAIAGSQAKKQRAHDKEMAKLRAQQEAKLAPGRAELAAQQARMAEAQAAAEAARAGATTKVGVAVAAVFGVVVLGLGGAYILTRPKVTA